MSDNAARAAFLAGLPVGAKGELIPGHTTWDDLGPKTKDRYRRMAQAVIERVNDHCTEHPCRNRSHYELRA